MKIHSLCLPLCRISERERRSKKADRPRKESYNHLELGLATCHFLLPRVNYKVSPAYVIGPGPKQAIRVERTELTTFVSVVASVPLT